MTGAGQHFPAPVSLLRDFGVVVLQAADANSFADQ